MGFLENFCKKYLPKSIEIIENKKEGIVAFEIINNPNPFVPERVQSFDDFKNGISMYSWGGKDIFSALRKKKIEKKELIGVE